jgi:hypothetical protein
LNPADKPSRVQYVDFSEFRFPHAIATTLDSEPCTDDDRVFIFKGELLWGPVNSIKLNSINLDADQATRNLFPITDSTPNEVLNQIRSAQASAGMADGEELLKIKGKIVVPATVAAQVVEYVHVNTGHFGASSLKKVIAKNFAMKGTSRICSRVAARCPLCQIFKGDRKHASPDPTEDGNQWGKKNLTVGSWVTLGIDIFKFDGHAVLSVTDLISRLVAFEHVYESGVSSYTSKDVANAFEILCYRTGLGFPSVIYIDNDPVWSRDFTLLAAKGSIQVRFISTYSPFTSFWERKHSELSKEIKLLVSRRPSTGREFQNVLDKAAFIINRRPSLAGRTPLEVLMLCYKGRSFRDLNVVYQELEPQLEGKLSRELDDAVKQADNMLRTYLDAYRKERQRCSTRGARRCNTSGPFKVGEKVLVFNFQATKATEKWIFPPRTIVAKKGLKHYVLDGEEHMAYHEYNLKRYIE